jgi:hypothetical protein
MIEGMDDWMKLKEKGRGGRSTRLIKHLNFIK